MNNYEELCKYCKLLYERKLVLGTSGNASIRKSSYIALTQSGVSLNDITTQNISEVDFEGKVLNNTLPSSEKFMHLEIYKARDDVNAIVHSHSPFLTTFALKGSAIENTNILELNYLFKGKLPIVPYFHPGSTELAQETSKILNEYDAALLQNHGAIVVGKNIQEAFYKYEILEFIAQLAFQEKLLRD